MHNKIEPKHRRKLVIFELLACLGIRRYETSYQVTEKVEDCEEENNLNQKISH